MREHVINEETARIRLWNMQIHFHANELCRIIYRSQWCLMGFHLHIRLFLMQDGLKAPELLLRLFELIFTIKRTIH